MSIPDEKISMLPRKPSQEIARLLIAEAAYYRAQKRGFTPGHEDEDWLEAEKEIKIYLSGYFDFLSMH
ncbi:MAG: DUF2934 domain-containing protein [Gammaproteobacteria bacterium]